MKIGAIVQARMSSQRFPGKVLHRVHGRPMLQYLLERLAHCRSLDSFWVATSTDGSDDPVANFCNTMGVVCGRGSLHNVAGRIDYVLQGSDWDAFVRVNGDSPLLDQRLIEMGIEIFQRGKYDIVTNVLPRSFPKGQSVEVIAKRIFCASVPAMKAKDEQEHVTVHFYKNAGNFCIGNFSAPGSFSDIQLSVDSARDMEVFSAIVAKMEKPHWEYSWQELVDIQRAVSAEPSTTRH